MTYLGWLLRWFEAISRLKINLDKSKLFLVGGVDNLDDLASKFGFKVASLPSFYLGLLFDASFKSVVA